MFKLVPETQQDLSASNPQPDFMNFIYAFIYLCDVWCRAADEKLKRKFISRTQSRAGLKFELLNFEAPPATEKTRASAELHKQRKSFSLLPHQMETGVIFYEVEDLYIYEDPVYYGYYILSAEPRMRRYVLQNCPF